MPAGTNCLCVLFLLTQHVRSSLLGPGWWKVPITSRAATNGPVANSGGSGKKRKNLQWSSFFIMDAT